MRQLILTPKSPSVCIYVCIYFSLYVYMSITVSYGHLACGLKIVSVAIPMTSSCPIYLYNILNSRFRLLLILHYMYKNGSWRPWMHMHIILHLHIIKLASLVKDALQEFCVVGVNHTFSKWPCSSSVLRSNPTMLWPVCRVTSCLWQSRAVLSPSGRAVSEWFLPKVRSTDLTHSALPLLLLLVAVWPLC